MRASRRVGGEAATLAIYTQKGNTPRGHDHRGRWFEMLDTSVSNTGTIEAGPPVFEVEVDEPLSLGDLMASLVGKHPAIGVAILDVETGRLFDHVDVVHNDALVGSQTALAERVEPGDSLVFLPAFSGG